MKPTSDQSELTERLNSAFEDLNEQRQNQLRLSQSSLYQWAQNILRAFTIIDDAFDIIEQWVEKIMGFQ